MLFWINFMECHSIQFTTISINVERGIVKILFKYRYFQDLLIDIDIDIDIFQNHHIDIDIDIDIFGIALSIFSKMTISILISISIFFKSVDISTINMSYRYIEQGYTQGIMPVLRAAQVKEELLKYAQEAFGVNRNLSLNIITMFNKFNQN